jgi:hypothetical protein
MATGMVRERTRTGEQDAAPARYSADDTDLQRRYEGLLALVLRTGAQLTTGAMAHADGDAWEAAFTEYRQQLLALRALAEQLRPRTLRDPREILADAALAAELAELFAA